MSKPRIKYKELYLRERVVNSEQDQYIFELIADKRRLIAEANRSVFHKAWDASKHFFTFEGRQGVV